MKEKKPVFLKTFSEFTIAELRTMPSGQLFSLFFQEVFRTFRTAPKKRSHRAKKNVEKPILTVKIKPVFKLPVVHAPHLRVDTTGFSAAMKRVFTLGPYKVTVTGKKQASGKTEKQSKTETVVFPKSTSIH